MWPFLCHQSWNFNTKLLSVVQIITLRFKFELCHHCFLLLFAQHSLLCHYTLYCIHHIYVSSCLSPWLMGKSNLWSLSSSTTWTIIFFAGVRPFTNMHSGRLKVLVWIELQLPRRREAHSCRWHREHRAPRPAELLEIRTISVL